MKYTIYTDGGSRGNPGPAAIGVVIKGDQIRTKEYGEYIGVGTNNEAEYKAIIFALKKVKLLVGGDAAKKAGVDFYVDSELIVKQLSHEYKVKDDGIQKLFLEVHNLRMDFGDVTFHHVFREKNKAADKLVNQVLDREESKLDL
jgi:ribonuclease HI